MSTLVSTRGPVRKGSGFPTGNKYAAKPLVTEEQGHGCIVPVSHAADSSGYSHKRYMIDGKSTLLSMNREEFRRFHGIDEFPPDTQIDHLCDHRRCINPNHMQMLSQSEHMAKTRNDEQSDLQAQARLFWMLTGCTPESLRTTFRLSPERTKEWLEKWQADASTPHVKL